VRKKQSSTLLLLIISNLKYIKSFSMDVALFSADNLLEHFLVSLEILYWSTVAKGELTSASRIYNGCNSQ
jgi:hypothetical protein